MAGDVRDLYQSARSAADARGMGLRVTLYLTEAPKLMSVPWEFLFERPSFLAQSIYTPLVRSLDLQHVRPPYPVDFPLHVLGVVSRPKGVPQLDVEGEQQRLVDALAPLSEAGLVTLEWLPRATLSELHDVISRPDEIHVLHYIGHGAYDERTDSGILVLEDDDGLRHEVTGEELGSLLQDERCLRLVVLNSCEGARTSHVDPFSGVASSLVGFGIPAVIGMQFEITDDAAITFAGSLYKAVVRGYPIDAALAEVRKAIFAAHNDVEFGTPVLFLRASDAHLFDFQGSPPPLPEPIAPEVAESDMSVDLAQRPPLAQPGERVTWQLTIENTGGRRLNEVTATDESGRHLAAPIDLDAGDRHIVRWRETSDPEARHLITVSARAPDNSILSEQTTATVSTADEETADVTRMGGVTTAPPTMPPDSGPPSGPRETRPLKLGSRRTMHLIVAVVTLILAAGLVVGGYLLLPTGDGDEPPTRLVDGDGYTYALAEEWHDTTREYRAAYDEKNDDTVSSWGEHYANARAWFYVAISPANGITDPEDLRADWNKTLKQNTGQTGDPIEGRTIGGEDAIGTQSSWTKKGQEETSTGYLVLHDQRAYSVAVVSSSELAYEARRSFEDMLGSWKWQDTADN